MGSSRPKALVVKIGAVQPGGTPQVLGEYDCDSVVVLEVHHIDGQSALDEGQSGLAVLEYLCGPERRRMTPTELFQVWAGFTAIIANVGELPDVYRRVVGAAQDNVSAILAVGRSMGAVDGESEVTHDLERIRGGG